MKKYFSFAVFFTLAFLFFHSSVKSQVTLNADGPGNTYELINSVLAPGYNAVEAPDASHPAFGRHIAEVFDAVLNKNVFEFYSHVAQDNDPSTTETDRQRVEIKTYDQSPANLKGTPGEVITYKWRFMLPVGFQPSSNFTHIHQIKAVGGDDSQPIMTVTPRKASNPANNTLQLIYNLSSASGAQTLLTVPLAPFIGVWVEATETVAVGATGTYAIEIKRMSDGFTLLTYSNGSILTYRSDNSFIRPKWGIYRSLLNAVNLRDEAVRFSDFSIIELAAPAVPKIYFWVGGMGPAAFHGVSANWNTAQNGTGSTRTAPASNDVLIFDGTNVGGGTPVTGPVLATATTTAFGRLIVRNGAQVTFERRASTGTGNILISGDSTLLDDFIVDATSSVKISSSLANTGLTITLGSATSPATGIIGGELNIKDNNIYTARIYSKAANALKFLAGSKCTVENTVSGDFPFGSSGTSASDGIAFLSGSSLVYRGGVNPYASNSFVPINFETGSNFILEAVNAPDIFEKHFLANVTVRNNAIVTGENFYNIDTLRINPGASFLLKNSGTSPVSGDIINDGTFGAAVAYSTTNLVMTGTVPQSIGGTGTFTDVGAITVAADAHAVLNRGISVSGSAGSEILGELNALGNVVSGTGAFQFRAADSAEVAATLVMDNNVIALAPAAYGPGVNTANVAVGAAVTGAGIPPASYIISTNSSGNTITLSNSATITSGSFAATLSIVNAAATLITANTGGADGSIAVSGAKNFAAGTNLIFNAPTVSPFPAAGVTPAGNVIFNAAATTNRSQVIGGLLTINDVEFIVRGQDTLTLLLP